MNGEELVTFTMPRRVAARIATLISLGQTVLIEEPDRIARMARCVSRERERGRENGENRAVREVIESFIACVPADATLPG